MTLFLKKNARTLYSLVIVGILFLSALPAFAAAEEVKGLSIPALLVLNTVLIAVRQIATWLMTFAAMLLNAGYAMNLGAIPSQIPAVSIGWAALRDLTNGMFLLIILWIALTIIFNVEHWGGKRLLANVLLVALLINFSLLMVTIVFGFANQIGAIFAKGMPPEPGTFIAKSIEIQNLGNIPTPAQKEAIKAEDARRQLETQRALERGAAQGTARIIKDTALASLGVPQVNAAGKIGFYTGCAAGLLIGGGITYFSAGIGVILGSQIAAGLCGGLGLAGAISDWMFDWGNKLFDASTNTSMRLATQIFVLIIAATTMFMGGITLFIRYAAAIALSVLAPAAFLAAIIPGMKRYFDMWVSQVLKWAFFLPFFYLMMYLGFYIMSTVNVATPAGVGVSGHANRLMIVLLGVIFMWMALRIARQTGGAVGEWGVNAIAKTGLFAAGGVAGLAMRGAGAAIAAQPERAQELAARARRIPLVGRQIQQAMGQPIERDRKEVEKRQEEMKNFSVTQLGDHYRSTSSRHEKIAAARLLVEREKLDEIAAQKEEAYRLASNAGMAKEFLTVDPTLAMPTAGETKEEAIRKTVAKLQDKTKISKLAFDPTNPNAHALTDALVRTASTKELSRIGMQNTALMDATKQYIQSLNPTELAALKMTMGSTRTRQLTEYFDGHMAGGIGAQLGWKPNNW